MTLIVHKYGGTSMGSIERIRNVARRIAKWLNNTNYQLIIVVSAMSGETNRLLKLANSLTIQPSLRELDVLTSTGEQISVALLAIALQDIGIKTISYVGWQIPIYTDNSHTQARIINIKNFHILSALNTGHVVIVAGFQGIDINNNITTLGRGGSDTSAVAIAAAMQAQECLIYTDVDGIYTADPRIVNKAKRLKSITFEEMLEMASLGAKVLHTRSVEFAGKFKVKTRVLSSFTSPDIPLNIEMNSGTLITFAEDRKNMEKAVISGISCQRDEAIITITTPVSNKYDIAYQILKPITDSNIDIDMIVQNHTSNEELDFSFTLNRSNYSKVLDILQYQVLNNIGSNHIKSSSTVSKISIIGIGIRSHSNIITQVFYVLAKEKINIQMISISEIKISILIDEKYMEQAVLSLHKALNFKNTN